MPAPALLPELLVELSYTCPCEPRSIASVNIGDHGHLKGRASIGSPSQRATQYSQSGVSSRPASAAVLCGGDELLVG